MQEYRIVGQYRRLGTFQIDEILEFIGPRKKEFMGYLIKMNSLRYHTFKKNIKCAGCGIEGTHFALESHNYPQCLTNLHFNLYAINAYGDEVLMTKDHIIPRSKGGRDHIDNMQTMCTKCNGEKDDKMPEETCQ